VGQAQTWPRKQPKDVQSCRDIEGVHIHWSINFDECSVKFVGRKVENLLSDWR